MKNYIIISIVVLSFFISKNFIKLYQLVNMPHTSRNDKKIICGSVITIILYCIFVKGLFLL